MRNCCSCLHSFFSVCAAHYLKGETEIAMIISEPGDEVTEPFGVDFPFVMHNYRGLFTVLVFWVFFFCFLMIHIFILCSLPREGYSFSIFSMNYYLECYVIPRNARIKENSSKLNK